MRRRYGRKTVWFRLIVGHRVYHSVPGIANRNHRYSAVAAGVDTGFDRLADGTIYIAKAGIGL